MFKSLKKKRRETPTNNSLLSPPHMKKERLAQRGPSGAEELGFYLNRYFERMIKFVGRSGGDVFKFAGDAMLVLVRFSLFLSHVFHSICASFVEQAIFTQSFIYLLSCKTFQWPEEYKEYKEYKEEGTEEDIVDLAKMGRRAAQCALDIQVKSFFFFSLLFISLGVSTKRIFLLYFICP